MKYSLLIPVYNRPDEVDELLESLTRQAMTDFEVIVVDDGSSVPCADVVSRYDCDLNVHYYAKPNSGPGQTRNYAAGHAHGEYLIILDSDVVLPPGFLAAVDADLSREACDAFGGPDRAHPSFSPTQKAINYAMTSFFTTGGIRGGKKKLDKFYPRSFNMGMRADVYRELGGFSDMRFGEDIDLSTRLFRSGHTCRLLPAVFTVGCVLLLLLIIVGAVTWGVASDEAARTAGKACLLVGLLPLLLFSLIIGLDATVRNRSLGVGLRAIVASFVQLVGYGSGFLRAWWHCCVRGRGEFEAFRKNFYK